MNIVPSWKQLTSIMLLGFLCVVAHAQTEQKQTSKQKSTQNTTQKPALGLADWFKKIGTGITGSAPVSPKQANKQASKPKTSTSANVPNNKNDNVEVASTTIDSAAVSRSENTNGEKESSVNNTDSGALALAASSQTTMQQEASAKLTKSQTANATVVASQTGRKEQRLALVIGNSNYKSGPLANPANDARAMTLKLQQLGFTVIKKENATKEEMMSTVREFGERLKSGGVGLFYYAGHGIQSKGVNYLIPVDSNVSSEDELSTRAYNANEVLEKMDTAKNRINMVILDACRDNPFARSFRSGSRGLAGVEQAPSGTLIAYSTAPGSTASDGSGSNGLYTEQLLQAMSQPGLKMEEVFKRVRASVIERSGGKQNPWEMSSVVGDFYFNPSAGQANVSTGPSATPPEMGAPDIPRNISAVVISKKLIDTYQLASSFSLGAAANFGVFSHNSQFLNLSTKDKTLAVWNADNGMAAGNESGMNDYSIGQRYLLALSDAGKLSVTDLRSNDVTPKPFAHLENGILIAGTSSNGKRLLTYTKGKGFSLYDTENQQLITKLEETVDGDPQFSFSPSDDRLVTWGSNASNMTLWDTENGTKIARLSGHKKSIGKVKFSADGTLLLSSAPDDKAFVWRTLDGATVKDFAFGEANGVPLRMEFLSNGKRLLANVSRSGDKTLPTALQLGVWDMTSGALLASLLPAGIIANSYKLTPDNSRVFISANDRNLYVVDLSSLARINIMVGMQFIDFSSDGRRFLIMNREGVRLMDTQTLSPLSRMPSQVRAFVPPKKSSFFVTGANDGTLILWNMENGDRITQVKGHIDTVAAMFFSDDSRRFLSVGSDNAAKLWTLPKVKEMDELIKDNFESTSEYHKRLENWSSPYSAMVNLVNYNADTETFTVKFGDISVAVPMDRESAKKLSGQRQAMITGTLKFFDVDQLALSDSKLIKLQ